MMPIRAQANLACQSTARISRDRRSSSVVELPRDAVARYTVIAKTELLAILARCAPGRGCHLIGPRDPAHAVSSRPGGKRAYGKSVTFGVFWTTPGAVAPPVLLITFEIPPLLLIFTVIMW